MAIRLESATIGPERHNLQRIFFRVPKGQYDQLDRGRNSRFVEEEVPTSRKAKGLIHPLASKSKEGSRNRHVHRHLCNAAVDAANHTAPEEEGEEQRARSAFEQRPTDANEERRANRASNRNELDLAVVERAVCKSSTLSNRPSCFGQRPGRFEVRRPLCGYFDLLGSHGQSLENEELGSRGTSTSMAAR